MKPSEIRDMRAEELTDAVESLEKKLFELRSQAVTEKMQNSMAIKNIKRDIARVKTIIRQRELKGS